MSDEKDTIKVPIPYNEAYPASGLLASGEPQVGTKLKIDGVPCRLLENGGIMYAGAHCTPIEQFQEPVWDAQFDRDGLPEPKHWFKLFTDFRSLGYGRKLIALYRMNREERGLNPKIYDGPRAKGHVQIIRPPGNWEAMYVKWRWKYRAEVWDAYVARSIDDEYIDRQKALREKEWKKSEQLFKMADGMLKFPLEEEVVHRRVEIDGKMVDQEIHYLPVRWTLRDIVAFVKAGSELGRLSIGGEEGADAQRVLNIDVKDLTYDELERIANGEDAIRVLADKITG